MTETVVQRYLLIFIALLIGFIEPAYAQNERHWRVLLKYLQKDIRVISLEKSVLVISHPAHEDTIWVGLNPCIECDIIGVVEHKRGDNPYRVWIAHERFWNNNERPKSKWGEYFRSSFLRILRPPTELNQ